MNKAYAILKDLRNRDRIVRLRAAQSAELISILKETKSSGIRGNVIEALGLVEEHAIEPLLTLFKDPDFDICIHSFARAFSRVGEPAYVPLSKLYQVADVPQQYRIAIVLGHMGERNMIGVVLDALHNSPEWWVRVAAAETFLNVPTSDAVNSLIYALNDRNLQVRMSAAKALGRIGDPRAIPALEAACKRPENKGDAYSSVYTVEYFASGAIRIINQWKQKR